MILDASLLIEKNYRKNRKRIKKVSTHGEYVIECFSEEQSSLELFNILSEVKSVIKAYGASCSKIILLIRTFNPRDKLVYILLESILYTIVNIYHKQIDMRIGSFDYNINTWGWVYTPSCKIAQVGYDNEFNLYFQNDFSKNHYRKVLTDPYDEEAPARLVTDIKTFLDRFHMRDALKELVAEMQVYAISTRELEIEFSSSELVANQILAEMQSADKNLTVGAMTAAYHCILAHPDSAYAQKLLDEMLNILRYCKRPGVIAAAWNVHNLLYAKCEIMQEENLKQVDTCLVLLAEMLQTDSDCDMKFKSMLHVRKISVAIAFLMYQLDEAREYCGVLKWKAIAEDSNEINEVRNEWVWEEEWQRA